MSAPTIVVAAPASGSGKTVVTLAIARALRHRGLDVAAFKVGPDYIDTGFHTAATGRTAVNLDPWAMRLPTLAHLLEQQGRKADLVVGEGVMGLFDAAADGTGSTGDLCGDFGLPVVLVVDVRGVSGSIAAVVDGFLRFRDDVRIDAVILNRAGGESHRTMLRRAIEARSSVPILGFLPRDPALELPDRHLGLVQAVELEDLDDRIDRAARIAAGELDLERIVRLARHPSITALGAPSPPVPPLGQRIAVARDAAFAFAYESTLQGWHRAGATVVPFSPLADEPPDPSADAAFLPGGYPELHAERLAACTTFLAGLRAAAARDALIYGECGGYMVLGETLVDAGGTAHRMAGLLPVTTSFAERRRQLGYRRVRLLADLPALGPAGAIYRGHEFHYATETARSGEAPMHSFAATGEALGPCGARVGRVLGSFIHLVDREDPR